jgi:hypothetical protein
MQLQRSGYLYIALEADFELTILMLPLGIGNDVPVLMTLETARQDSHNVLINEHTVVAVRPFYRHLLRWLTSVEMNRIGGEFWIDISLGHNLICALYLKYCGNKSVAIEHVWQDYLKNNGNNKARNYSLIVRSTASN